MTQPSQPDAPAATVADSPEAELSAATDDEFSAAADDEPNTAADDEPEFRMTPLLWTLGILAVLVGLGCGLVLSVASLNK